MSVNSASISPSDSARRLSCIARWAVLLDGLIASVLVACIGYLHYAVLFERLEWFDWVAYALPSANLATRGSLSLPQLGTQFGFDRYWLFSSPLMGLGPFPWYVVFGVGRVAYLLGTLSITLGNIVLFAWAVRRALRVRSMALPVLIAGAFLGHAVYQASLFNQRYDLLVYTILVLAFLPGRTGGLRAASWQWLVAGLMPLAHPAMGIAFAVWLIGHGGRALGDAMRSNSRRLVPWLGLFLFVVCCTAAIAWYGRAVPLKTQLLPHLRTHMRHGGAQRPLAGWYAGERFGQIVAGRTATGLVLALSIVALRCGVAAGLRRRSATQAAKSVSHRTPANDTAPAALAAAALLIVFTWDALKGFTYLGFYVLSLGPAVLAICNGRAMRLCCGAILCYAALVQAHACMRIRPLRPQSVDQHDTVAFVVEQTRPGDRIVVGPPFVLAAAARELPGGRRVLYVVPQPFYLDDFDVDAFRSELRDRIDVYIGEERWFHRAAIWKWKTNEQVPLVDPHAPLRRYVYYHVPVIVARAREKPPPR